MANSQLIQVSEDGQVILPFEVRQHLGVDHGGTLALVETADGVLMAREEALMRFALDRIGAALAEQGLTLDELIESGREERTELLGNSDV